jgi:hypothetical protein
MRAGVRWWSALQDQAGSNGLLCLAYEANDPDIARILISFQQVMQQLIFHLEDHAMAPTYNTFKVCA